MTSSNIWISSGKFSNKRWPPQRLKKSSLQRASLEPPLYGTEVSGRRVSGRVQNALRTRFFWLLFVYLPGFSFQRCSFCYSDHCSVPFDASPRRRCFVESKTIVSYDVYVVAPFLYHVAFALALVCTRRREEVQSGSIGSQASWATESLNRYGSRTRIQSLSRSNGTLHSSNDAAVCQSCINFASITQSITKKINKYFES